MPLCCSAPGVGSYLQWRVTSDSNVGPLFPSQTSAYTSSYGKPVVTQVQPAVPTLDTRGGNTVVLLGYNFGSTSEADNQV